RNRADGIVRNSRSEQVLLFLPARGGRLESPKSFDFSGDDQIFVFAKRNSVLLRKWLRAFCDKVNMRTLTQHLSRGPDGIRNWLDAANSAGTKRASVHNE